MILKMILKSFDFQCDFDFQITTSKMILILNHLYLGDLILKSSTYDDFAHLCPLVMKGISRTIREKREVLVRMSKLELLNHHQAFVVSLKNAFAMVLELQYADTEGIALLCTVSSTLRVGADVCIPHFCCCGERIYSEGFHGLLTQCWPLSNAFDNY